MGEKRTCRICGEEKELDLFEIDKRVDGNRTNRCKSCKNSLDDRASRAIRRLRYRAKKEGIPLEVTLKEIRQLYDAHDGRCVYCGVTEDETGKSHHLDHVTPTRRGGTHHMSNLVLACSTCNLTKADKPLITHFLEKRGGSFTDGSLVIVVHLIALLAGQPADEVYDKLINEHAEYVCEQIMKDDAT